MNDTRTQRGTGNPAYRSTCPSPQESLASELLSFARLLERRPWQPTEGAGRARDSREPARGLYRTASGGTAVIRGLPAGAKSEGRWRGRDKALLRRLSEELHCSLRSTTGELPRGSRSGCRAGGGNYLLTNPGNRATPRQAPQGGLPFPLSPSTTLSPFSRGGCK